MFSLSHTPDESIWNQEHIFLSHLFLFNKDKANQEPYTMGGPRKAAHFLYPIRDIDATQKLTTYILLYRGKKTVFYRLHMQRIESEKHEKVTCSVSADSSLVNQKACFIIITLAVVIISFQFFPSTYQSDYFISAHSCIIIHLRIHKFFPSFSNMFNQQELYIQFIVQRI